MPARHALLIGINRYPHIPGADLQGAVNDAAQIHALLTARFGFGADEIVMLCDEAASRDAIRAQMATIAARVGSGDLVAFFFAGHGSRIEGTGSRDPAIESIVPADSGRDPKPNRDIPDLEIDRWVQQLNRATPFVTLIMDCCHSGSVTRDPFSENIRAALSDLRGFGAWAAEDDSDFSLESEIERPDGSTAAWIAGRRQAVVLAACQAQELAWEHRWWDGTDVQFGGAFTYFLRETLAAAPSDATWRSIFEPLEVSLTRAFPEQHALAEGKVDELLFGRDQIRPVPYLPVLEVKRHEAILGGGLAHGVHLGSRWEVHGPAESEGQTTTVSTLKVTEIRPTRCIAHCESEPAKTFSAGQRARLIEDVVDTALALEIPSADDFAVRQLAELIRQEPLLAISSNRRPAEIRIRRIPARQTVRKGDPCPYLGSLDEPQWAAVGRGGDLVTRLQPEQGDVGTALLKLVGDLLLVARFWNVLAIDHPNHASPLRKQLRIRARNLSAGAHGRQAEPAHKRLVEYREGDRADFEITNDGDGKVYFTLLELGTDFQIKLLAPFPGHPTYQVGPAAGGIALAPGGTFSVRDYCAGDPSLTDHVREGLQLRLPDGFPWSATSHGNSLGLIYLKLLVTTVPTDFGFLAQPGARPAEHAISSHPLVRLVARCTWGSGTRSFATTPARTEWEVDWVTESLVVSVRR
ncbi:MAG: caspase family protein [bacterium]|nr:caspase family protein [bacterium]